MLDKLKSMRVIIFNKDEYPCGGVGKKINYDRLFNSQNTLSECNILSLKQRNAPNYSLRVPLCFLPGKLPAGCSSTTVVFKTIQCSEPHPPTIEMGVTAIHKISNDPVLSTPKPVSKSENGEQRLSITDPVNFVRVNR